MNDFTAQCARWQTVAERHGCIFDNLRFVEDSGGFVRMLAAQPDKPARLRVTNPLLIPRDGIELTDEGQCVLPPYCEDDELRGVLDEMLAYILNPARVDGLRQLYRGFAALPDPLPMRLANMALTPQYFSGDLTPTQLKERLIQARVIKHNTGKTVFMPFVDFINHDAEGIPCDVQDSAIVVQGKAAASGEVFALYSNADTWHLLNTYFFPGRSLFAYSVAFQFQLEDGIQVRVGRRYAEFEKGEDGLRLPKIERDGEALVVPHVWLGAPNTPRKPYRSFATAWASLGRADALAVFSQIVRFNWFKMVELLRLSDGIDTPAAQVVRAALRLHMANLAEQLLE